MKHAFLAAASGLAFSAFLSGAALAQASGTPAVNGATHTDANGMPTNHSTPAEHAATADLNGQVAAQDGISKATPRTAANDAQYQAQQQQYQQQQQDYQNKLQQNHAQQQQYQDRRAAYEVLRDRYRAERAAYHRGVWPDRYARWTLDDSDHLTGQRVEILGGAHVGTVSGAARTASGRVEGLEVSLDSGKVVWIDRDDLRYDRGGHTVVTNLDRHDLYLMADERA
jgi:hypothetical protein